MLAVIILSLLPPNQEPSFSNLINDKIKHFSSYAVLGYLACHAGREWRQRFLLCLTTFTISVIIEFVQPYTGRDFDPLDMVANLIGILAGIALMLLFLRWRQAKTNLSG